MHWFRKKLNSLFSRTVMGMLMISLSILIALSAVFMIYFRKEMLDGYRQLTYTTLGNIDASFSQIITDNKRTLAEWRDSADGTSFRLGKNVDPVDHMSFVNRIRDAISRSSYSHSIYFVNKEKQVSLFLGSNLDQTEDLDELLIAKLNECDQRNQPFVWNVRNRYKSEEHVSLLTIPVTDVRICDDDFNGMIVMNISLEHLRSTLLAENDDENVQIIMIDTNGNVICHNNKEYIGENWSEKEWVQRVTGKERQFEGTDAGEKWGFCAIESEVQDFYLVAQSSYGTQSLSIKYIIYMVLVISIGVGIVLGIMMLLVSRRIFAPFTNMVGTLKKSSMGAEVSKEVDEVTFLEHFYQGISTRLELLNDKKEKDFIVKNLLLGNLKDEIIYMMKQKGIITENQPYYMFLVSVQNKNKARPYNMQEYDMSRNMISGAILASLEEYGHATYFEVGLRRMLFVISGDGIQELSDQRMLEAVNGLENAIQKVSQIKIYGVLSEKMYADDCVTGFKQLSEHLKTRQILEKEKIIALSDAVSVKDWKYAELLTQSLKEREKAAYMQNVEMLLDKCALLPYQQFSLYLEKTIQEIMKSGKVHKATDVQAGKNESVKERILALTDREELLLWLESIYDAAAIQMNRTSGNATAMLMENAIDYIRNNYDDCNLNVNMLADRVGLSAAYFGKLFTEFTGTRALDYILKIRMERAHDLLLSEVDKDIANIASRVGYNNSTYFTTAFKKYYGMTPSLFRDYYLAAGQEKE